jgi:hypothetical protein
MRKLLLRTLIYSSVTTSKGVAENTQPYSSAPSFCPARKQMMKQKPRQEKGSRDHFAFEQPLRTIEGSR